MSRRPNVDAGTANDDSLLVATSPFARIVLRGTARHIRLDTKQLVILYQVGSVALDRDSVREVTVHRGIFWDSVRIATDKGERVLRGFARGTAADIAATWATLALLDAAAAAVADFQHLLERDEYFNHAALTTWNAAHGTLAAVLPANADTLPLGDTARASILAYRRYYTQQSQLVEARNTAFVARKKLEHAEWFASAAGEYGLTDEQQDAILHDEDNCLVVAGAGTGKTSVVAGKCGYLAHTNATIPERILLLAFTNKSAEEMRDRLKRTLDRTFNAKTFHALGLEIVAQAEGRKPAVSTLATDDTAFGVAITQYLNELLDAPASRDALIEFFAYYRYPYHSPFEFETPDDYLLSVRAHDVRSLNGELVQSHEEAMIADWLYLNGIEYEYERDYEHDTASVQYRQYKPDFYLPECDVYLEHFGVNRANEPAPHIDAERYRAQMKWKRELHTKNGTTLLETYSWQRMENGLLEALAEHMRNLGATLRPRSSDEIAALIREQKFIAPVTKLVGTFLSLYKSNAWTAAELARAAGASNKRRDKQRDAAFLRAFQLVLERYEAELDAAREVDYSDMIARAARHVESGRYLSQFTHVIVDECQDFSRGRARLLRALLAQVPGRRLFCVGDDWQSIYRFTGSDIAQMTHFHEEFGFTKRCDLTHTHRFGTELLAASSKFVQENPAQLRKALSSPRSLRKPAVVLRAVPEGGGADQAANALHGVLDDISTERPTASVLVLGRYHFSHPDAAETKAIAREYPRLQVKWHTVHAAKGLEEDYAVVLNVASGKYGFPSEMTDDPILDLVLAAADGYPNAEERRLFYVALTRARQRVFVLAPASNPSKFVRELSEAGYGGWVQAHAANRGGTPRCIECGVRLVRRTGYDQFWGCANFPRCGVTAKECPKCRVGALVAGPSGFVCTAPGCGETAPGCPGCGVGMLVWKASGKNAFLGCTEYRTNGPSCRYTRNA